MKKIKRFILVIVSLVLVFAFCSNVTIFAVSRARDNVISQEDIIYARSTLLSDLMAILKSTPNELGFSEKDIKNVSVGEGFNVLKVVDNEIAEVKDIVYFPIISNGHIIALLTLMKDEGELFATIGKDFAPQLDAYLSNEGDVVLVVVNKKLCGINRDSVCTLLFDYSYDLSEQKEYVNFDELAEFGNVISLNRFLISVGVVPIASVSAAIQSRYLTNYPIVAQGNLPICWAATVASMVIYEVSSISSLTATQVCNAIGHSYTGGDQNDVINALRHYLSSVYVPTYYSRAMTKSEIKTIVNNNDPAYMSSHDLNSSSRHATALCGYSENGSTFQIKLMDPAYACFKYSTYSLLHGFRFDFGSTQYKWDNTVRLLYNL